MNRPRESLLTLFDPLFSGDPTTPPSRRDAPSPDLGSDKENAPPANDSPITLTKFFNRIYTRPKAHQQPRPLSKGRLVDVGDANASYDDNGDNDVSDLDPDSDDGVRSEHVFVVRPREPLPTGKEEEREEEAIVGDASPRRPLADIALGDSRSRSSPIVIVKTASSSSPSPSPFGSPSPFKLARPTPAPSSSPLASVINAINGTTSPPLTPSSSLTPSAPRIALTPAEPSSPSPMRRQPRPGAMLHASPEADARRTSVDLQASLSVHFDGSSFDLLKDKISLPENDSMGELDMDMGALTIKTPERTRQGREDVVMLSADSESESDSELDCASLLDERLRDMKIEEDAVQPSKDDDRSDEVSTPPPVQPSSFNFPSQFFSSHTRHTVPPDLSLFPHSPAGTRAPVLPSEEQTARSLRLPHFQRTSGSLAQARCACLDIWTSHALLGLDNHSADHQKGTCIRIRRGASPRSQGQVFLPRCCCCYCPF